MAAQVTSGVRAILSLSRVYDLFQKLMGAKEGRKVLAQRYIRAKTEDRVLDIGCGTAQIIKFLPEVLYWGFDPNPRYIQSAKEQFGEGRYAFSCTDVDEAVLGTLPKFDIVLALGVLHHITDDAAVQLARLAKIALKKGGRLVTIDPCFVEGQSPIARFLISRDRGQHVRNREAYQLLMGQVFNAINVEIRHDLARFPYTHLIMECASH